MSSKTSNKERWEKAGEEIAQQQAQPSHVSRYDSVGEKPTEYKAWSDWLGNVNISNLSTGKTNRFHQNVGVAPKRVGRDTFGEDFGQSVGGALQRQGANYKSALATLGLGAAGLLHGDNNYQPEVGSWLWRLQEGAEADTGVANQLAADSKYGRGALGRFTMDLTSGAVDLAGDQILNLIAPGSGMAAMAARSFGGSAEEQREQGKSISTQFFKGLKSAAIEYGTEKFAGIGGLSIEGGGYIDNLLSRAEESIVRKGGNAFLTKLGFAFGSEAVEEMMSDWLNPLADKFLAGVVKGDYDIEDFPSFAEVAYDGLVGGALGLLGGAREGLQAQSRVRSMGGNQGYADFLARERADTKAQVKAAKEEKRARLKAIFDYATHHAEQAMDRAKNIKANEASQTPVEAQQAPTQQVTPEAVETPENATSREFKSKPEAETDVPFTFGEETAPETVAPAPEVAPATEEVTPDMRQQDDDAEPREALEEVSRWKTEKPVEDTADAEKEGKEFSPEETTDVFHGEADEERLRSLAEQEKEQDRRQTEYFEEKESSPAKKAPKAGADLLVEQAEAADERSGKTAPSETKRSFEPYTPRGGNSYVKDVSDESKLSDTEKEILQDAKRRIDRIDKGFRHFTKAYGIEAGWKSGSFFFDDAYERRNLRKIGAWIDGERDGHAWFDIDNAESWIKEEKLKRLDAVANFRGNFNDRNTGFYLLNNVARSLAQQRLLEAEIAEEKERRAYHSAKENKSGADLLVNQPKASKSAKAKAEPTKAGADVLVEQAKASEPAKAEAKTEPAKTGTDVLAKQAKADKKETGSEKTAAATADESGTPNITREERIDAAKRRALEKIGRDYTGIRDRLAKRKKAKNGDNVSKYDNVDVSDKNVPAKERLQAIKDFEKAKLMDEVDDYVGWWMNHKEIVDGENMSDTERMRLLPKKIERFIEQYDANHNYEWEIDNNRNDLIRVYSDKVSNDVKSEEFNMRYSDEQLADNARKTRLKHALSFDLSTKQIANVIEPLIKPKLLTQHFNIGADGVRSYPYSINLSWPQRTNKEGKQVPVLAAAGGQYTVELYCNDAKTDTAVRVFRFKAKSEAAASKIAANMIRDFELGGLPAKEAIVKKTRKQISDELTKQLNERTGDNPLAQQAAPKYSGTYTVGPFSAEIGIATREYQGMKYFNGYTIKVLLNGAVLDNVKTDGNQLDLNPLSYAASLIHNYNFERGKYYNFSWLKHRPGSKFEASWTVTTKNGKSVVTAPNGSVVETDVGRSAMDDISKASGGKIKVEKEEKGVFKSNFEPKIVEVNGKLYEVVQDWMSKNAIQHVIYEVDANGNRVNNEEAKVNVKNAIMAEDAVQYALDKKLFKDFTSDKSMKNAEDYAVKKGIRERKVTDNGGNEEGNGNGNVAERRNDNGLREGSGDNDQASGNPGADVAGGQSKSRQAARRALRGGESVSLDDLFLDDGYSSDKSLTYVGEKDLSRDAKAIAKNVKAITGKDVQFVRGRWGADIDPESKSRIVARTSLDGEIVFNLDYFEYARSKGSRNSMSNILYHESFHSLVAQNPALMVFAKKTMNKLYGDKVYQSTAKVYADKLMGAEKAKMFLEKHDSYPSWVYEEMAGDVFGNAERYNVKLDNKATVFRDEMQKALGALAGNPEKAAKLNEIVRNQEGFTRDATKQFAEEAAMPEDLDGISERIKSSENKFYGERKANITKAAEAISKNIGKDASTVLPEDLADFVGKDFSQASKDIDGFAKEFLTAMATEDDGASLKTLADDLPKRIKKSKALKELLGDAETGNVAKMARVLAEAEDAKTAQNAASDLAEMIAKEAEEMPKRLKTLEQWDKNLSKRSPVARFLSGDKTVSQLASVYFGYQRDMINVLQGLDNFDKYGKGYGYELAKKILDANFKSQTALGNSIDHVLTAQAEFEKSGGANKTVELKMLKKNQWESHQISLAEAVDFLHTIRTLQASKINAWQDITYHIGDQKLTISSLENFNRIMDDLTKAVRNDKAANAYYQSFTEGYAMFKDSSKEAIRDASGRTVDMFEDGTYYPISSAPNGQASAEHDYDFGLDSTRYMQRRVSESGGVIQVFDPAVRFNSYAHTAANLVARAATGAEVERLNRGGLGKSITDIVEERYGKGATDTVKQYIKDSSNFRQESDTASSLLRNLRLNIQGGALFGNFGSMLKQFPSVYNAAGVLDFDSITHGIIAQMNAGNRKRAAALGSIKTRHQGNLDPSVAETLNENSGFKKAMEKLKILKFAKEGFEIVDSAAIRTIYLASEYQVEVKDNISRDSAEFNDRVMDYFIPAFLQTQPQFEKTLRPYVQTSDRELIRMFGMFKTQPLRNLNTMIRTISEYSTVKEKYGSDSKEFKETEKQLRHTVAGQASASLMFGALGVLAKLLYHRRKDLEDKEGNLDAGKVMSRVLMNAAEASGGMLVFGDAAVQMAIDMASGGKTNEFYGLSAGAVSSVADALDAITTFAEKPNGYNAKKAAGYIATLFGIPLNNAYAILNSAIMYGKDISGSNEDNYDDILKYLDAQAKAAKKEEEKAAKAAAKEAEKSGADMLADTAKQNASQSELNSQEEQKTAEVSTYLKKPYQALLDSGMSSEKSQDLLAFIDTDDNNSIKQAEMFAFYKDNPDYEQYVMAMWNSYGYKTSWESYKAKHK